MKRFNAIDLTIANLQAINVTEEFVYVQDSGREGMFKYDPSDVTTVDDGAMTLVAANGRRYKRQYEGPVLPEWFGAVGDGVADDTAAIRNSINYTNDTGGGQVLISTGVYNISSIGFTSLSNIEIIGEGFPVLKSTGPGDVEPNRSMLNFNENCNNIKIRGIEFDGAYDIHSPSLPTNTVNHCISIGFSGFLSDSITCERFWISECIFRRSGWPRTQADKFGDNIAINSGNDIWIENNQSYDAGRWHISVSLGARISILNNNFFQDTVNRDYALGCIDIEYANRTSPGGGHLIKGNTIKGMPRIQISGSLGQEDITITDNHLDNEDIDGNIAAGAIAANKGIQISDADKVVITNNIIKNVDNSSAIVIDPNDRAVEGYIISENIINTNGTGGITISSGTLTNLTIQGNIVKVIGGFQALSLLNSNVSEVNISKNYFESSGSFPARISSLSTICVHNRFVAALASDVEFYCTSDSIFAFNSYNRNYRFQNSPGSTNCLVFANKGGISGVGVQIGSAEGTVFINAIDSHQKNIIYATTVPTTGSWNIGDLVYNSNPTASGTIGWVCVAAGTPGTWKTFGTIEA